MKEKQFGAYVREAANKLPASIYTSMVWEDVPSALFSVWVALVFVVAWFVLMATYPVSVFMLARMVRASDRRTATALAETLRREGWPEDNAD